MAEIKDNDNILEITDNFAIGCLTFVGDREEQQDSINYAVNNSIGLFVVADGMGGKDNGKFASACVVNTFIDRFNTDELLNNPFDFLKNTVQAANDLVKKSNEDVDAGSTLVAVLIIDKQLFWCSVGDSRAYLMRNGEFVQFTQDHNYLTVLNNLLETGALTKEKYDLELEKSEALISFVGIDDLELIDFNDKPFELIKGDIIVLMTDGLYRVLSEETISGIINNFNNMEDSLSVLKQKEIRTAKKQSMQMDNTTVIIIKIM